MLEVFRIRVSSRRHARESRSPFCATRARGAPDHANVPTLPVRQAVRELKFCIQIDADHASSTLHIMRRW